MNLCFVCNGNNSRSPMAEIFDMFADFTQTTSQTT